VATKIFAQNISPKSLPNMGIWTYAKKIGPNGVSLKRASKMQLRDVTSGQDTSLKSYGQKVFLGIHAIPF